MEHPQDKFPTQTKEDVGMLKNDVEQLRGGQKDLKKMGCGLYGKR
jgi:hypothetical protein